MTETKQRNRLQQLLAFYDTRANALRVALELLESDPAHLTQTQRAIAAAARLDRARRNGAADHAPAPETRQPSGPKKDAQRARIAATQQLFDLHEPRPRPDAVSTMQIAQLIRHGYLKKASKARILRTTKEP